MKSSVRFRTLHIMENEEPDNKKMRWQNKNDFSEIIETSEGKGNAEGIEKATGHIIVELVEYIPNTILRKTIMKSISGHVSVSSFDTDEVLAERISPFVTYIQIIEGKAEIIIAKKSNMLLCGQSIIIPAPEY